MTTMPNTAVVDQTLLELIKNADGYVTIPYLADETGYSPEVVEKFVENHPHEVRKSIMYTAEDKKPLLRYNSRWSLIADLWAGFRLINAQKFGCR